MKLAVTGANGFLGTEIARLAAQDPVVTSLRLTDISLPETVNDAEAISGDLRDPSTLARVLDGADAVIHLAAILGSAAEQDPVLARQINVDVVMQMIETLRRSGCRLVFASSVAVLGPNLPSIVTDDTPTQPTMVYGAHKAMIETALSCEARNGLLDAVSLRPAGIVARDGLDAALKTAFLSRLFWAVKRSEDITLPIEPDGQTWLASVTNVARNFLHAALCQSPLPVDPVTLPALAPRFDDLVAALQKRFPNGRANVTYAPDPDTIRLFGRMPKLDTPRAFEAGFSSDADLHALIDGAMPKENTP